MTLDTTIDVTSVMEASRLQQQAWQQKSPQERGAVLNSLATYLHENMEEVIGTLSSETGKPVTEAQSSEWFPTIDLLKYYAKEGPGLIGDEKVSLSTLMGLMGRKSRVEYRPKGVVAVISPWNYPLAIPLGDIAAATLAGNSVILKPSEKTPKVGELIRKVCEAVELPVTVIQGEGKLGAELVDAKPDMIMFTGGPATGRRVATAAAQNLTPVSMELGGKDPMLVLADANLENAAKAAVWGCFTNLGQVCCSAKRLYVEASVADELTAKILENVKALRVGDPSKPDTDIGHMIDADQVKMTDDMVTKAVEQGATLAIGGSQPPGIGDPRYYLPTVLTGVTQDMDVAQEEIFGPILPIIVVKDVEEAIRLANDSKFGLGASVFSKKQGDEVARRLKGGTVTVNDTTYAYGLPQGTFGGIGESGYGRVHGKWGLQALTDVVHVNTNNKPGIADSWWFPYGPKASELFSSLADFIMAGGPWQRFKALFALVKAQRARDKEMAGK